MKALSRLCNMRTMMSSPWTLGLLQVQKEKLHAELKQVLSKKRSHLTESTCQLAQPEMDAESTEEQTVRRNQSINATYAETFAIYICFCTVVGHQINTSS